MIILTERQKRYITGHDRMVMDKIDQMAKTGRLDGLSLADFNTLQSVMRQWLDGETPKFLQSKIADWLSKNGIYIKSTGNGFIFAEKVSTQLNYSERVLYREGLMNFKETNNLPAIAKLGGVSTNPKITTVVRQDTIYDTVKAMGLPVKINAMKNVVAETPDSATASAVASTIYQQFGVKCTFTLPWDGSRMKLYWAPDTPVESAPMLAYAKTAGLPPPNPRRYLS